MPIQRPPAASPSNKGDASPLAAIIRDDFSRLCRSLVEDCPDAILVADREGVVRYWNRSATRLFGFEVDQVLGQSLDLIIPAALRERHWLGYDAVMGGAATRYAGDALLAVPAVHRDGHRLSIEFKLTVLRDERGAILGVAAYVRDVTTAWKEQQALKKRLSLLESKGAPGKEVTHE